MNDGSPSEPAASLPARRLELDADAGHVRILFPYDPDLLPVVRALPGRRWHPDAKHWSVPADHWREAVETLAPYGFEPSSELRAKAGDLGEGGANGSGGPNGAAGVSGTPELPPSRVADGGSERRAEPSRGSGLVPGLPQRFDASRQVEGGDEAEAEGPKTYNVSQLNEWVRARLVRAFPAPLWITGEVLGYDRNAHKNHIYFQLADKAEGDDRPRAVVNAVLFDRTRRKIEQRLRAAPDPLKLADGLKIRVRAKIDLYVVSGQYQLVIEDVDPEFTLGDIARRRERILQEVTARGLRTRNRDLPFPRPCLRLALITSLESDAYNDLLNELEASGYPFSVELHDAHVQGQFVERDLLRALTSIRARATEFDAIAIVRGGGSRTDLMGFDSLPIALAVAEHPVKVLIGIGHHRDRTVLDDIAHAEKTPTAIGKRLVSLVDQECDQLRSAGERLRDRSDAHLAAVRAELMERAQRFALRSERRLHEARSHVGRSAQRLETQLASFLAGERGRLGERTASLRDLARRGCADRRRDLEGHATRLPGLAERLFAVAREQADGHAARLPGLAHRLLATAREQADARASRVRGADPARLLERGFAWLVDENGDSIKSVDEVELGQVIRARLADGSLRAIVDRLEPSAEADDL
ncbi:MAG: exodeoxyribonuclease VII large subunit [Planctomycetota bacterium]